VIIENLHFQFQPKANRGDSTRLKGECLKLNAPTAAKLPLYLSSLQWASQFTAERASQNTHLSNQKTPV
jgi:hypothetical protein